MRCVKDQNGNHVIQKAIQCIPPEHISFIINGLMGQIRHLASHTYGCRVIQRLLEHAVEPAKSKILQELHDCSEVLIHDTYGNYVIQHVIQHGEDGDRTLLIDLVLRNLFEYTKDKFASNVVEKCIEFGGPEQRDKILASLMARDEKGESPLLLSMMRDQYANYVVRKYLSQPLALYHHADWPQKLCSKCSPMRNGPSSPLAAKANSPQSSAWCPTASKASSSARSKSCSTKGASREERALFRDRALVCRL